MIEREIMEKMFFKRKVKIRAEVKAKVEANVKVKATTFAYPYCRAPSL